MNICIIGGGNIGTAMAALISSRGHSVVIKTKRPELWSQKILYTDMETKKNTIGHLKAITNANSAVSEADMILITTPSFLIKEVAAAIIPYVRKETPIGIVPGTGGAEFFFKSLIQKGYLIFGFDRVPCIARINEYGKSVLGSKKKSVRL